MWDWLEEQHNYRATLFGVTAFYILLPVLALIFLPVYAPLVVIVAVAGVLGAWRNDLADMDTLGLTLAPRPGAPTGLAALVVRLRLAVFGAVTSYGLIWIIMPLMGSVPDAGVARALAVIVTVGIPLALVSTHAALWMLSTWRVISGILLDAAGIGFALTLSGRARKAAFQKLYDEENTFFVRVAGYQTGTHFAADPDALRDDLPRLRR